MAIYTLPTDRRPAAGTWEAAGIGEDIDADFIDALTIDSTILATGTTADRQAVIQAALTALPEFSAVKLGPGDFYLSSGLALSFQKRNRYLIGSVDEDGAPTTFLRMTGGTVGVSMGTSFNFTQVTTGSPASFTKGAVTLEVASSTGIYVGRLAHIAIPNEADTPVSSIYNYEWARGQLVMVAGKPDSTHITIEAPGLHGDFSGASSVAILQEPNGFVSGGNGVANVVVDATTHANYHAGLNFNGITIQDSYRSWVYNCKTLRVGNYGFAIDFSVGCQLQRIWAAGEDNGSSTAGIFVGRCAQSLVHDFIIADQQYAALSQYFNSGNVFSYGYVTPGDPAFNPSGVSQFNINHDPYAQFTLLEGLRGQFILNDGYFGGSGLSTYFRNACSLIALKRLSRDENVIGNVFPAGGGISAGDPYIGNSGSNGTSSMRAALCTLAVRGSASAGTLTAPAGHGVTTGATVDLVWNYFDGAYNVSKVRRGVLIGTVSGVSVPFSGGDGDDLPSEGAGVYLPTDNASLRDYSVDWDATAGKMKEWPGVLTSKVDNYAGTLTLSTGLGASLAASIAAAYAGDVTRGMWVGPVGSGALVGFISITNITGDVVTFDSASHAIVASAGAAITVVPCPQNMPEKDMDVILTTLAKANSTNGVIPSVESIGSDTLGDSMFLGASPKAFVSAGLSWPPYNPFAPDLSHLALPAGVAYDDGWWPLDANTVATPVFSPVAGDYPTAQSITISCPTVGASIRYTTGDGSQAAPTSSTGTVYSGPVSVTDDVVIKAIAYDGVLDDSAVRTGAFTITPVPAAPTGLTATAISSSQINLAWTNEHDNATSNKVERKTGIGGTWAQIATVSASATSYSNTGLSPSTEYYFRVKAANAGGDSTPSNEDNATTEADEGEPSALNFPPSPDVSDVYSIGGRSWRFNGTGWAKLGNA